MLLGLNNGVFQNDFTKQYVAYLWHMDDSKGCSTQLIMRADEIVSALYPELSIAQFAHSSNPKVVIGDIIRL